MEINKSQRLWYLLNRFDRDNESILSDLSLEQDAVSYTHLTLPTTSRV